MRAIVCQECEAELHGLDLSTGQPKCKSCGAVVVGKGGRKAKQTAAIEVPPSIQVQQTPHALTIRVPWRLQNAPALTMLTYAGIIGLVLYLGAALEIGTLITVVVAAVVGAGLFAVRMINDTIITVSQGRLDVRHGPLPWLSRQFDARRIDQLYVDRRPLEQKKFDYSVRARLEDEGGVILLFRSLADPVVALYLEQCLEQQLHIVDTHVSGEFLPEHMHMPQQHAIAKTSQPSQPAAHGAAQPPHPYPQHYSVPAAAPHAPPVHEQPVAQPPGSGWPPRG